MRLDGCDLAPDLVEMDRGPGVELHLQRPQVAQQLGRAHVRRPGGDRDAQPALGLAVPFVERVFDQLEMLLAERAVELVRGGIADLGADPVEGADAQHEAHPRVGQGLRIVAGVGAVLEDQGRAAAQGFERAQLRHRLHLLRRHLRRRNRRQAAGEGRLVRRRQVLEHAARDSHGEMRVHVGEARHHHLVGAVDPLRAGVALHYVRRRTDGGDAVAVDGDRGVVVHRVIVVHGDDGGVMDDSDQGSSGADGVWARMRAVPVRSV